MDKKESYKVMEETIVDCLKNNTRLQIGEHKLDKEFMFELLDFCRRSK